MSIVSIDSKSIFATMPKVKTAMAIVPEKVPSEKMSAQTSAIISVGSVRIRPRMNRISHTTGKLLLMLLDERIATGSASTQPITVPRIDILIVSIRGEITFGKKVQSGWKIFSSRSTILRNLVMTTCKSKPVIFSDSQMITTRNRTISGALLLRRWTE